MNNVIDLRKNINGWVLTPWFGNTNLSIVSYLKLLKNPFNNRKTKIWVWLSEDKYNYTVNAGANSDYSHTGGFEENPSNMAEAISMLESKYNANKLFV